MSQDIRVIVIDDHPIYREGLVAILQSEPPFRVVGEAGSVADGLEVVARQPCDLLLTDLHLGQGSGLEVVAQALSQEPNLCTVVLTIDDREENVAEALTAGARGYVVKTVPREELLRGLRSAYAGETFIHRTSLALTAWEGQILQLVCDGQSNQDISSALHISVHTVKSHLRSLFGKLGVVDRAGLAVEATARGLLGGREV